MSKLEDMFIPHPVGEVKTDDNALAIRDSLKQIRQMRTPPTVKVVESKPYWDRCVSTRL